MNREADYTIKGFIYQFNKTLEQVFSEPNGTEITVEGIIEDIDVNSEGITKAIQCKYHETKEKYNLSDISKPILQMLVHYSKNKDKDIQYILYAHFSDEEVGGKEITKTDIETILKSKDKSYLKYISTIKPPKDDAIKKIISKSNLNSAEKKQITDYYNSATDLDLSISIDDFLKPEKFNFVIGQSFDDLINDIKKLIKEKSSFSTEDINDLFYPNAIQIIANKSILHNSEDRKIINTDFIRDLEKNKKTAISRWTRELKSYENLLKNRRLQLKPNLQKNHRLRYLLFNEKSIINFENEIVKFISDYIGKYHYKLKLHNKTPIFCIKTENNSLLSNIENRLHTKRVSFENGIKGNEFFQEEFLKEPKTIQNPSWKQFDIRICDYTDGTTKAINSKKSDDLFFIGKRDFKEIDKQDINIENIEIENLNELQYLLLLSDNYK